MQRIRNGFVYFVNDTAVAAAADGCGKYQEQVHQQERKQEQRGKQEQRQNKNNKDDYCKSAALIT